MSDVYHLDYETYSPQPLGGKNSVGAFRYASDPTTEILVIAIAKNDETPLTWDALNGGAEALWMLEEAVKSGSTIYAHNAQFEHAISTYHLITDGFNIEAPKVEQWGCTAAMCRLAAIPSSLEKAGEFLGIDTPKDREGTRLINIFSVPRKATAKDPRTRIMPADEPEEFQKFVDYCARDVVAEQQVYNKLKDDFPLTGWALDSFRADLRMNSSGIPVNLKALNHANNLMEEFLAKMIPIFRSQVAADEIHVLPITKSRKKENPVSNMDGFNPTQGERMKIWLGLRGWTGEDLQADTVADWLENPRNLTAEARVALHTYSMISSAAVKKIPAMIKMACEDGYVRGALMVFGAERTHRWTGKGMQPQNFARPRIDFTELAYDMICQECSLEEIESIFGNFFDVLVSVIRHFIQPHAGDCLQADYSSIEARVAPWLVGEQATLDLFEAGEPLYELMASIIFGIPVDEVTIAQRFIGKQAVLGCSYNMGRPKFRGTCESYGFAPSQEMVDEYKTRHQQVVAPMFARFKADTVDKLARKGHAIPNQYSDMWEMEFIKQQGWDAVGITPDTLMEPATDAQWLHLTYDDLADRAVTAWRLANPKVVASWKGIEAAAKEAITKPRTITRYGKLAFCYKKVAGFNALLIKLPSGHKLVYPRAKVVPNTKNGWGSTIEFWGVIPNSGGKWGWCSTYGGKLLENCTQATAGDVMRHGMSCAEREGYPAFMLVHDEILTLMKTGQTSDRLCELLCELADWMEGLPLEAEGGRLQFYKK